MSCFCIFHCICKQWLWNCGNRLQTLHCNTMEARCLILYTTSNPIQRNTWGHNRLHCYCYIPRCDEQTDV